VDENKFIIVKVICIILIIAAIIFTLLPVFFFAGVIAFNQPPTIFVYCLIILLFFTLIITIVKKSGKMAFVDPYDKSYERKTNKELYSFVAWSCGISFIFAVVSFAAFAFVALLWWFYLICFMVMFSRVWKFHGKKRWHLFTILIMTIIISFIVAPFIREVLLEILHFYNIY